jgi:hypothetical protein
MEAKAKTAMVCLSEGMTLTIQLKPMTNNTNDVSKTSIVKQAATLIALSLAPLTVVIGIAAVSAPSAEAYVTRCSTDNYGNVKCRTSRY